MATRSMIAMKEGSFYLSVYCHFDGYPEGVGATLREYYTDLPKVNNLISRGGMSTLAKDVALCEFYTSRGEELDVVKTSSLEKLKSKSRDYGCQYLYVFNPISSLWKTYKL